MNVVRFTKNFNITDMNITFTAIIINVKDVGFLLLFFFFSCVFKSQIQKSFFVTSLSLFQNPLNNRSLVLLANIFDPLFRTH